MKKVFIILLSILILGNVVDTQAQIEDVDEGKKGYAQITFSYPIGTHGPVSAETNFNLSINVLNGVTHSIDGAELGGLFNSTKEHVRGTQIAGLFNETGAHVQGVQTAGLFNKTGGYVRGIQTAGIFNQTGEHIQGTQVAGVFNQTGGYARLQVGGIFNQTKEYVHAQVAGIFNQTGGYVRLQVGGIFNQTKYVQGVQIGGIFNQTKEHAQGVQITGGLNQTGGKINGIQIAGIFNQAGGKIDGIQIAGIFNQAGGKIDGIQIAGVFNQAKEKVNGMQIAGVFNQAKEKVNGMQIAGVFNQAKEKVNGMQIAGVVNKTGKLSGMQIGLINLADTATGGGMIGIYNSAKKGGIKELQVAYSDLFHTDFIFRSGTKSLYSVIRCGVNMQSEYTVYGIGAGVGTYRKLSDKFSLNVEGSFVHVNENGWWTNHHNMISSLNITPNYKITNSISVFIAPSMNVMVSEYTRDNGKLGSTIVNYDWAIYDKTSNNERVRTIVFPGYSFGIKFHL